MTSTEPGRLLVRPAAEADLPAIAAIAMATGQDEDWEVVFPAYVRHVMARGRFLVAECGGAVTGYGGTMRVGDGQLAVSMLTDLFVDPAAHGGGAGRSILSALWPPGEEPRRMTFSSLHANALPLYTSFGMDAWWPLLYLTGDPRRLPRPAGWSVSAADPSQVAALELAWTGIDRSADHGFWAGWPNGSAVVAALDGRPVAAGAVGGPELEFGVRHLAIDTADDKLARDAVIAVLSWLDPANSRARCCLPAPHPAVRALLGAGWRVAEFDLHMASEPGMLNPRRAVPSAALA